jgi:hypothetical protein
MMENIKMFYLSDNFYEYLFNALADSALAIFVIIVVIAATGVRTNIAFVIFILIIIFISSLAASWLKPRVLPKSAKIIMIASFACMLCALRIAMVV